MRSIWKTGIVASIGLLSFAALAPGQVIMTQGENAIAASGVATIMRPADLMRVQVELTASGKTAKDAVKALTDMQESAKKKLTALGAADADIHFEAAELNPMTPDRQRQVEMMMNQRGKKGAGPSPIVVGSALMVEFPLKKGTAEERLLAVAELEKSVDDADLPGKKTAAKTPEEEETQEEASGANPDPTNGVVYLFVAKVSAEDRAKTMAEAFGKAKAHASEIAKAAGVELGALRQLTSMAGPDDSMAMNYYGGGDSYALRLAMQAQQRGDELELIGTQPGKTSAKIAVNASFAIK